MKSIVPPGANQIDVIVDLVSPDCKSELSLLLGIDVIVDLDPNPEGVETDATAQSHGTGRRNGEPTFLSIGPTVIDRVVFAEPVLGNMTVWDFSRLLNAIDTQG